MIGSATTDAQTAPSDDPMSLLASLIRRLFGGERRRRTRTDPEHAAIMSRQERLARRLAMRLNTTPEELLDYRRADRILSRR